MSEKRKIVPIVEVKIEEDRVAIYLPLEFDIVRICIECIIPHLFEYMKWRMENLRRGDCA